MENKKVDEERQNAEEWQNTREKGINQKVDNIQGKIWLDKHKDEKTKHR